MKQLADLNFLIFFIYFVTFCSFPGVLIVPNLLYILYIIISGLSSSYKVNTYIALFNLVDTIGRKMPSLFKIGYSQFKFFVFFRSVFLITLPILACLDISVINILYF